MPDRLERLLNLTAALLTTSRPLTAAELAARVPGFPDPRSARDAFHRSFERDKAALRDMGIPLRVAEVPGTDPPEQGYLIRREDYALREPGLEPDEMAALQLALAAVRVDGVSGSEALLKLGGADAVGRGDAIPLAALPAETSLVPLFAAVADRAPVTFGYRGEARHIDPHRLSFSRGHWYLDGFDHDRQAERQFRLDRIEGAVEIGASGSFERPPRLDDRSKAPWELGGGDEPVEARVTIDESQAEWALSTLPEGALLARNPDGSIDVAVTVSNREGFRSFVLGFLDHAVVREPPELRQAIVDWLSAQVA